MAQSFTDFLSEADSQTLDFGNAIIMLWSLKGDRIYAASQPAIRLFGGFKGEDLTGRRFGPALPSTARIAELGRRLEIGEPARVERLRFFLGHRSDILTCLCRRVALKTGEEALLLVSKDPRHVGSTLLEPQVHSWVKPLVPRASGPELNPTIDGQDRFFNQNSPANTLDKPASSVPTARVLPRLGTRPLRFVFETDAAGRVQSLSPQLAEAVGPQYAALIGRTFAEVEAPLGLTGTGTLIQHLKGQQTWRGISLAWPIAGSSARVPVEFSGLPIYDAERKAKGFRGFGLIRLDLLSEDTLFGEAQAPAIVPAIAPSNMATAQSSASPASIMPTEFTDKTSGGPTMGDQITGAAKSTLVRGEQGSSKFASADTSPIITSPATRSSIPASSIAPSVEERLSQTERNAFREIAKALGARLAEDMPEPPRLGPSRLGPSRLGPSKLGSAQTLSASAIELARQDVPAPLKASELLPVAASTHLAKETGIRKEAQLFERAVLSPGPADADHNPNHSTKQSLANTDISLVDYLPIGILIARDHMPVFANRTLLDLLDYEDLAELASQRTLATLFDRPVSLDGGEEPIGTIGLMSRDGERLEVAAHAQPIIWRNLPATLLSFRSAQAAAAPIIPEKMLDAAPVIRPDRTSEIESRQLELRHSLKTAETERDEFKAILDTATDGVISLDAEGRIIGLNRSAEALFGFDRNEVAGQRFSVLLAGESHAGALDYLEGLKSGGVASLLNDGREVIGREKKGGRNPLNMTLGRISERDTGKFCAVLRDLTAWRKAEAELTESRRVAERASAMKSDFLAKISHEIRTPMNAIIGFAEVMSRGQFGPIGNERYQEYLGDIHSSGQHVISLVNDLLDLSKIEAGRADLSFTSVNLNEVVQDCVSMMQPQAARERVIMRLNLTEKLPRVVADERSVKQVVLNLVSNACKFNQPGGQVILSTALSDEGEAVIRVRDTGIGMSEKDIEGAMQPFRQMSATRKGGGTGLGLPLTKALVEANRASFAIKSAVLEGTLVEVTFPATRVLAE